MGERSIYLLLGIAGVIAPLAAQPPSGSFQTTFTLQSVVIPANGAVPNVAGDKVTTSVTKNGNSFTVTIGYQTAVGSTNGTYTLSRPAASFAAMYIPAVLSTRGISPFEQWWTCRRSERETTTAAAASNGHASATA